MLAQVALKKPSIGTIVSVRGSVVDVRFEEHLPAIYSVLRAGDRGARSSSRCWHSWMRITCAGSH